MTKEEFTIEVLDASEKHMENYPCLRKGQSVFKYVDENYGPVARQVQFEDGVDCLYIDEKIDAFLDACWNRIDVSLKEN